MTILTDSDKTSPIWIKIKKYCEDQLNKLRIKNDGNLDVVDTAKLRGEIAAFKRLLILGEQEEETD